MCGKAFCRAVFAKPVIFTIVRQYATSVGIDVISIHILPTLSPEITVSLASGQQKGAYPEICRRTYTQHLVGNGTSTDGLHISYTAIEL